MWLSVRELYDLLQASIGADLRVCLTLRFDEHPALLFPSELSECWSEAQTRVQRWRRVGDSASPPQRTIKGRARGTETPLSRRSPAANTSRHRARRQREVTREPRPSESTWSSLSAALATSPDSESSLCRTGPSTDRTCASSQREGYNLRDENKIETSV